MCNNVTVIYQVISFEQVCSVNEELLYISNIPFLIFFFFCHNVDNFVVDSSTDFQRIVLSKP